MNRYCILRSSVLSPNVLRMTLDALRTRYREHDLDDWTTREVGSVEAVVRYLQDLSGFHHVVNIVVATRPQGTDDDPQVTQALQLCDSIKGGPGGLSWTILARTRPATGHGQTGNCHDLRLGAGMAQDGYWTKISISSESWLWNEVEQRRELFRKIIGLWGLEQEIRMDSHGGDFGITAHPPFRLRFRDQTPNHLNPTDMRVAGFPSLQVSLKATQTARDALAKRVLETNFGCSFNRDQYEHAYERFNAIREGWNIDVRGTITQHAEEVLNGCELTENSPAWIPAFRWYEDGANAKILGAVVIEDGQRHLEVATDGGSLELLQERVAFLDDIRFEPVFP